MSGIVKPLLFFAALVILGVYTCWDALGNIVLAWGQEEYSYAYFIPPLALLIGLHRLIVRRPLPGHSWTGVGLVFIGLVAHALGKWSGISLLPQYSLLVILFGLTLALFGSKVLLILLPALTYLFFAIPFPQVLYLSLSANMQLLSSAIGTQSLQFIGIAAFHDGNIIDLGNYKLQVAEACSGLRYLLPLLGFGYLVAYVLKDAGWKRVLIFISAVPIAILMNVFRIAVVGVTVNRWGAGMAEGFLHEFEGWIAFSVCIALLFVEAWILRAMGGKGRMDIDFLSLPKGPFFSSPPKINAPAMTVFTLFLIAAVGQMAGWVTPRAEVIPLRQTFALFPLELKEWRGNSERLPKDILTTLSPTDYLNIDYAAQNTPSPVNFFVAYYASQRGNNPLHSPEICLPGGGWKIVEFKPFDLTHMISDNPLLVNRVTIQKGMERQIVYYWFEQRGSNYRDLYAMKWSILKNSLLHGRTEGSLIRASTPVGSKESEKDADARLQNFLQSALPPLRNFVPDLSIYFSP